MQTIEDRRKLFLKLNAWLSATATSATAALLIAANIFYIRTSAKDKIFLRNWDVKWYATLFVFLIGLYVVLRTAYIVIERAYSANRQIEHSCESYRHFSWSSVQLPPAPPIDKCLGRRVKEIGGAFAVAVTGVVLICFYCEVERRHFSGLTACYAAVLSLATYAGFRLIWWTIIYLIECTDVSFILSKYTILRLIWWAIVCLPDSVGAYYPIVRVLAEHTILRLPWRACVNLTRSVKRRDEIRCINVGAQEIGIGAVTGLTALLATYLMKEAQGQRFSGQIATHIIIATLSGYAGLRILYCITTQRFRSSIRTVKSATLGKYDEVDSQIYPRLPNNNYGPESIRIKYDLGRLPATTYHVILCSIFGTIFVGALTQGPLWPNWRIGLSLFIGGLYPAGILLGLSYSVPADSKNNVPVWKNWRWINWLLP